MATSRFNGLSLRGELKLEIVGMGFKTFRIRLCAMVAVVAILPTNAWAAAFWNLDQGVSSYARGGANFVSPGDPTAVYLNPAALAGLTVFNSSLVPT